MQHWVKITAILPDWMVEFHQEVSALNGATPSSFFQLYIKRDANNHSEFFFFNKSMKNATCSVNRIAKDVWKSMT